MKPTSITKARYGNSRKPEHKGNPLIDALPKYASPSRLREALSYLPRPSKLEFLTDHDRMNEAKKVRKILVPTIAYVDFYNAVYHLLVQGYEERNPLDPQVCEFHYDVADPSVDLEQLRSEGKFEDGVADTTCEHLLMVGLSGVGKTALKNQVLGKMFPDVIIHHLDDFDDIQIVQIHAEMPHDGSRATLLKNLIAGIDNALKGMEESNYLELIHPKISSRVTIGNMEKLFISLCLKHHVGLIIIDEFQNIEVANSSDKQKMRNLFDTLSNRLNVPILKIGTTDSLQYFGRGFRHARRCGEALEVKPYERNVDSQGKPLKAGRDWHNLVKALFQFQVTKHRVEYTERLDSELYQLSCGIPHVLFTLWQEAQVEAIRTGYEKLNIKLLRSVFNRRFKLIKSALKAMSQGRTSQFQELLTINQLFDKGDTEPAIRRLINYTNKENFAGPAAVEILKEVEELEQSKSLTPSQTNRLAKIRSRLEAGAKQMKRGQTLEHQV